MVKVTSHLNNIPKKTSLQALMYPSMKQLQKLLKDFTEPSIFIRNTAPS